MGSPKVLITGITGFVGSHLAEYYVGQGAEVFGISRRKKMDFLKEIQDQIHYEECDITDAHSISSVIRFIEPEIVHHLAAQSFVPRSWDEPTVTIRTNLIGSLNVLEACLDNSQTIVHLASSSEVYGDAVSYDDGETFQEAVPTPKSPYGISKLAMESLGRLYHKRHGLKVVITRAFNHTGPRRGEQFVTSKIAKAFAEEKDILELGALDSKRDWTDVRDMVRAYALAVKKCSYGEPWDIGSGKARSIKSIVELCEKITGHHPKVVSKDKRPSDIKKLLSDSTAFRHRTGWEPKIAWEKTISDLINFWSPE